MKKLNSKGFTMVELLIVLAIIAILAAVAIPVYSSQLEASRKKVDESNLRAATGIAAQDYIVRNAGTTGSTGNQRYRVFTLKTTGSSTDVNNMMVYPAGASIDTQTGEVVDPNHSTVVFRVSNAAENNVSSDYNTLRNNNPNATVLGKPIDYYPIQQNGGKGAFDIVIGENGVVLTSRIVTAP